MNKSLFSAALFCMPLISYSQPENAMSFEEALDKMPAVNCINFAPIADAFLRENDDITDFYPRMAEAAKKGNRAALTWLASNAMRNPAPNEAEIAQYIQWIEQGAQAGSPACMFAYYMASQHKISNKISQEKAEKYFLDACKLGDFEARAFYLRSTNRLKPETLSSPEIDSELKRGNYAIYIALLMDNPNSEDSFEWVLKAFELGSVQAGAQLELFYSSINESSKAMDILKKGASMGDPWMMGKYADILLQEHNKNLQSNPATSPQKEEAIELIKVASCLGNTQAQAYLALANLQSSPQKAFKLAEAIYSTKHNENTILANSIYAYLLLRGIGCKAEPEKALKILNEALSSELGVLPATVLASAYFNGFGVEPDMERAIMYLYEAQANGLGNTYTTMAVLTALGNKNTAANPQEAQKLLQEAIEAKESEAQLIYDTWLKKGHWDFYLY